MLRLIFRLFGSNKIYMNKLTNSIIHFIFVLGHLLFVKQTKRFL